MAVQSIIDIPNTLAKFGLTGGAESEQKVQEQADENEIEDAISEDEQDSIEAEADSLDNEEEYDDYDEDNQSEEDFDDSGDHDTDSRKLSPAEKKVRDLEAKLKAKEQDHETQKQQIQQLYSEFQNLKREAVEPIADDFDLGDDDDYVEVAKVKKYVETKVQKTQEQMLQNDLYKKDTYLNAQPDLSEVNKYITEKNLVSDQTYANLPTDDVGRYYAVKNKMLSEKLKAIESKYQKDLKNAKRNRKNPPPPTGGSSRRSSGTASYSRQEQNFISLGKKLGIDLTPK